MPFSNYQRYIVAGLPLVIFGLLAYYFSDIVTYVVLAWVLSMVGAPLNRLLTRYVGSTFAAIGTLLTFSVLLLAIFWMFIPPVVQQARNFASIDYERLAKSFEEPLEDWNRWLIDKGLLSPSEAQDTVSLAQQVNGQKEMMKTVELDSIIKSYGDSSLTGITLILNINHPSADAEESPILTVTHSDDFFERAKKNILEFLNPARITGLFGSIVGFLGNLLITVLSVLFISFFFLKEQGLFTRIVRGIVPNQYEDQSVHAIDESAKLLIRYFIGIAIQIVIITVYISTILSFLGFKNALLIAFFAALMNVIPYVGPILGATFGLIIIVSANLEVSFYDVLVPKILKLLAVFASMQLLDNFVLQPNIFSKSVKAHPLEIFIVVLMGAKLGGVIGMILAIPAYTVIRVLAKVFLSEFKVVQRITKSI